MKVVQEHNILINEENRVRKEKKRGRACLRFDLPLDDDAVGNSAHVVQRDERVAESVEREIEHSSHDGADQHEQRATHLCARVPHVEVVVLSHQQHTRREATHHSEHGQTVRR